MISFENLLVHVRQRSGSQMTSISGVNPSSLKEIWRLDIGGGLAGPPIVNNEDVMAVNSQGDFFKINDAAIAAGGQRQVYTSCEQIAGKTLSSIVRLILETEADSL